MKVVLLIHQPQARGQEIFASLLGNALIQKGHEVLLISMYSGDFDLPFEGKHLRLQLNRSIDSINPLNWKRFSEEVREFQPDIVQANGGDTLKFAVLARLMFWYPGKLVFNNGGVVSFYLDGVIKKRFYRLVLSKIDGAVSVSQHAAGDLSQYMSKAIPQTQIPIALHSSKLPKLASSQGYPVFVHIAGFTPEKNHRELFLIFSSYLTVHPKAQLWMIGDGPMRAELERLARSISEGSFRFFGVLNDPWQTVPQHSILLLPSQIEGMPSVLAEAMLLKVPVIAYAVGGIPEMATDSISFRMIQASDSAAFLQAMFDLSELRFSVLETALEARKELAASRFSLEKVSEEFVRFYRSLCESSK